MINIVLAEGHKSQEEDVSVHAEEGHIVGGSTLQFAAISHQTLYRANHLIHHDAGYNMLHQAENRNIRSMNNSTSCQGNKQEGVFTRY